MSSEVLTVVAPLTGTVLNLAEVPDPVFAQQLVGPGCAIMPSQMEQNIIAPIEGRLEILTPHAFVIVGQGGKAVLVHLGVNAPTGQDPTSKPLAQVGQHVSASQPILRWRSLHAPGLPNNACPVVALDAKPGALAGIAERDILAGGQLFRWRSTRTQP